MKKFMQRMLQMTAVIALIVTVGVCMTACGGNDTPKDTNINNIDNLKGFYANIEAQKVYYFDGETYSHGKFSLSEETNENGLYTVKIESLFEEGAVYKNKLKINRGTQAVAVYKVWNSLGAQELLISTHQDANSQDLSKQFFARDEELIYSKISSLTEFYSQVFPGYEIDTTDTSGIILDDWKNLFLAA